MSDAVKAAKGAAGVQSPGTNGAGGAKPHFAYGDLRDGDLRGQPYPGPTGPGLERRRDRQADLEHVTIVSDQLAIAAAD